MGPHVRSLASQIEGFLGNGGGVVPCASGTDALIMALEELECRGRGVVVPAMTFSATYEAVLRAGAIPVLCDVDDQTASPTVDQVRTAVVRAIGNGTGVCAVVVVHIYGWAAYDIEAITQFCQEQNLKLIEDCAQCFGASKNGYLGTYGDAAAFSFYPTKPLGGIGDGGAAYFASRKTAKVAAMRANHGRNDTGDQEFAGYNSRLDEINAAILRHRLSTYVEANFKKRRELSGRYHVNGLKKMSFKRTGKGVPYVYPIISDERDVIQQRLAQQGIESRIHYEPAVNDLPYVSESCPNASWLSKRILSLPCHHRLTVEDIDKICDAVRG